MTLRIQNISKKFEENEVLRQVSFALNPGSINVLMGANGSGKTTLFNIISGFLELDSGELFLDKKKITKLTSWERNRMGVMMTFQGIRLIKQLSVFDNLLLAFPNQEGEKWWKIALGAKKIKQEQKMNQENAWIILKACFLEDIYFHKACEISYGQQKLLNIACCIANGAKIILLDEPVAGVNPTYRDKLSKLILETKKKGVTFLIIEHNTDFINSVADQFFFLNQGELREFKNYEELINDEFVKAAYI